MRYFDPALYDKIAEVFDIDTSGLHFKSAKSCNNPKEAVYNLLIARHLVKPSPQQALVKSKTWFGCLLKACTDGSLYFR